jgi:predicted nucleic acid-binding protein
VAILLDSTILIDALRGRPVADRLLRFEGTHERVYVCAVNAEEVERGVRPTERAAAHRLLGGLRVAPLGVPEGVLAGVWRREFAARGITLGQGDCLIAAAAYAVGARLATGNPEDFPMDEVTVEHWPVGK